MPRAEFCRETEMKATENYYNAVRGLRQGAVPPECLPLVRYASGAAWEAAGPSSFSVKTTNLMALLRSPSSSR